VGTAAIEIGRRELEPRKLGEVGRPQLREALDDVVGREAGEAVGLEAMVDRVERPGLAVFDDDPGALQPVIASM
jgi:hypothetical protein